MKWPAQCCDGDINGNIKANIIKIINSVLQFAIVVYLSLFTYCCLHICHGPPAAIPEECFNDTWKVMHAIMKLRTHTKHTTAAVSASTLHVHFTWKIQSMYVYTDITFRGAFKSHTWLVQMYSCHNTVWNVIMLDRRSSVNKSIMKSTV